MPVHHIPPTLLLAEQTLSGEWVVGLVASIVSAVVAAILAHTKGKRDGLAAAGEVVVRPQPLEVRESARFVTQQMCDVMHQQLVGRITAVEHDVEAIRSELGQAFGQLRIEAEGRASGLHERINAVIKDNQESTKELLRAIGRLEGGGR